MDSGSLINWSSESSEVLLNPRLPTEEKQRLSELAARFPQAGHVWIASSGSSTDSNSSLKLIALSKRAFLISARAVNGHLKSDSKDIWVQILPRFHVGGLSIEARVLESGARIIQGWDSQKWNPGFFVRQVSKEHGTLASLVPTQVHDLVTGQFKAPPSLRAVVVGGGSLNPELLKQAQALGWPLLPSYGLTECCSQVATAVPGSSSSELKILSHIETRIGDEGRLEIRSQSLLTGYAQWIGSSARWQDPKEQGWFQTEDVAEVDRGFLRPLGRSSAYVKVLGEGVHLQKLSQMLESEIHRRSPELQGNWALAAIPDLRFGHRLVLAYDSSFSNKLADEMMAWVNSQVAPFERIKETFQVDSIPRTDLGKVATARLIEKIRN